MTNEPVEPAEPTTSRMQDAVRLLLLIDGAAEPVDDPPPPAAPSGAVAVLRTQVLLQKLDFWLRNPDYFANMLLDRFEASGDAALLDHAERILTSEEPEIRRHPMLRYRFGAYEPLDAALSVLAGPGLVFRRREGRPGRTRQHNYYLTEHGREVAREIVAEEPALEYYVGRVALLVAVTAGQGGTELKDEQYRQQEYAGTAYNARIGAITGRVRQRLDAIREAGAA
ncbi:hypothetical protein CCO02nite_06970 [Cellulomonas composti]|uniref:Uncharacterized protein n=1 Tax=Cellulomonas composti TaxID=266130 RepID=A0A511J8J5_9CELL|nr:hypothetical protein CCO02nite_06970 [Cellulomonas composti]